MTKITPPRRLFLYGLALTPLLSLPYWSLYHDITLPFSDFFMLPVWTIHFLAVFPHEAGHLLIFWLFGHPAMPSFDILYGGGWVRPEPQQPWMLGLIYFAMAVLGLWLHAHKKKRFLMFLCALVPVHLALAFNIGHNILCLYLGPGSELLAATLFAYGCLFRGQRHATPRAAKGDVALRSCGVSAGIYLIVKNMFQMGEVMFGRPLRFRYSPTTGRYITDDIQKVAQFSGLSVPAAASVIFIAAVCCLAFLTYAAMTKNPKESA
ncbi:MAG: hypothetical protein EPN97_00595 [Alphaproteobacteria bacterium]|nr:MAG: hypothetical protein EPN97_00595 [Alphaproteobacteria bacterium]